MSVNAVSSFTIGFNEWEGEAIDMDESGTANMPRSMELGFAAVKYLGS